MILSKFFKNHLTIPQATKLFEEVTSQTHPAIADLKRLVNFHKAPVGTKDEMQALDLKYRAMTHVPTTIEKTMSPYQLYASNSPLWTIELSALSIESFLDIEKNKGKLSKTMFERTYDYETQGAYSFDIESGGSPYTHSITITKKG